MCPLPFVGCPQSPSVEYFSTVTHLQRAQQPTRWTSSSSSLPNARFGNVGFVQQPLGRASLSSHWSIGLFNDAEVAFQCFDRCHPPGIERMHRFKNPSIGTPTPCKKCNPPDNRSILFCSTEAFIRTYDASWVRINFMVAACLLLSSRPWVPAS